MEYNRNQQCKKASKLVPCRCEQKKHKGNEGECTEENIEVTGTTKEKTRKN